ncbi:hypothetical protein [Dendronalium sp. ChiSLP03b]|uniref:hypothetical protein n=1 Tax=Dendronalium sp. ChiSLP03b TaxID=3075381 RepID=UPI003919FDF2
MVQPIYSKEQLEKFCRKELHEICDALVIPRRRSCSDCITDILEAQPQKVTQAELEAHIEKQAQAIAPLEMNQRGYQDAAAGLKMQSSDPCYRMGYDRGLRDVSPITEDSGSSAIAFDKVDTTIHGGLWEANVNGTLVRIAGVQGGYKTNLTGDAVLVDFGIAVKESLLAVARLAPKEDPSLEAFATNKPNVFAVYSHKQGQPSKRYEVNLEAGSCTCPHYEHRHEQENFRDKHIEAVRLALKIRTTPLPMEPELVAA